MFGQINKKTKHPFCRTSGWNIVCDIHIRVLKQHNVIIFILAISPSSISDYSCFMSNSLDYECFIIFVLNIQFTFMAPHLGTMAARLRFISALA